MYYDLIKICRDVSEWDALVKLGRSIGRSIVEYII